MTSSGLACASGALALLVEESLRHIMSFAELLELVMSRLIFTLVPF